MSNTLNLELNNYKVSVVTHSENEIIIISSMIDQLLPLSNPREIVSLIEAVGGVESTIIKNKETQELVLASGLLSSEE